LSITSSADHSEVCDDTWIDGTATPVWHRMLHTLNKVYKENKSEKYFAYNICLLICRRCYFLLEDHQLQCIYAEERSAVGGYTANSKLMKLKSPQKQ